MLKIRYIGGKSKMIPYIDEIISKHLTGNEKTFVDLFGGSNVVGKYFKNKFKIISNDIMYFSYVIARGEIQLNNELSFDGLKKLGIDDPFEYFNLMNDDELIYGFVTDSYTPYGKDRRMYFTENNGRRIDTIRQTIEQWKKNGVISEDEYFYLLASLIESVPFISNITGTYGAYLKKWDKRAKNKLILKPIDIDINNFKNKSYNCDALKLLDNIEGDIVYIDTPYNSRQYAPNYHVLETIARNDSPKLSGVTGQRDNSQQKSSFAMKKEAKNSIEIMLKKLRFNHAVMSYSTDGIVSEKELDGIISNYSIEGSIDKVRIPYRKYKSKVHNNSEVYELIYYFKPLIGATTKLNQNYNYKNTAWNPDYKTIKSPLNYIGGKYKLLPQILPLFPKDKIETFVDLFSGGANVGINVKAKNHIFNDVNFKVNELFQYFQNNSINDILSGIKYYINKYNLSKENEDGFKKIRDDYNNNPNPIMLYTLSSFSFNYQIRFNSNLKYNNPFGRNRSYFSSRMEENLIKFISRLHSIRAEFTSSNFSELKKLEELGKDDFVYADPPYLITTGSYNDGKRGFTGWNEKYEIELYQLLDELNRRKVKFALSNVLEHKGVQNDMLKNWSKKYNVHNLNKSYRNSSYNTKRGDSLEVLITNY